MIYKQLTKSHMAYKKQCGIIEAKLQSRIDFGEVSVEYYPGDGMCGMVNELVVPLDTVPSRGKITEEWWERHAI